MVGQTLSHYRIVRALGAGGMGEVFLAEDMKLGRQVALKVLAHDSAHDPDRRARFEREARAIAALNHPGIVTIHSVEEEQDLLFITMELVEGKTLAEYIPAAGMPLDQLLRIAIPLTDAVGTAHQRGITHRDLKPANVMVAPDGRVKVLDFGLAKQQSQVAFQGETALVPTAHMTAEGKILGTVAYMSPEQAEGKPADQRSDIFSLGIVLFEMATGQKPFKGDSNVSVLSAVLKDTPPLVTDLRSDLPRELGRMIRRCLAKDPEERYQTAKDLRNDLKALKEDSDSAEIARRYVAGATPASGVSGPATAVTSRVASRPFARWIWAGLAVVVVIGTALGVAWWTSPFPNPRVTATRQITTDGAGKSPPVTDGSRLYFGIAQIRGGRDGGSALAQVSVSGGDTVQLAPVSPDILDIDSTGTELLVTHTSGTADGDLAVMPVLGGVERPVGDVRINHRGMYGVSATWTPDKSHIVYAKGTELRLMRSDGTESKTLLTAPGIPFAPRLSPDGERLRYTVRDAKTGDFAIWEAGAVGSDPHPLLPGWTGATNPCCGVWTPDGRYYVFEANGNLWARSEARGFRRHSSDPVQLTFGPLRLSAVMPSRDGKRLFAVGDQVKGRLARYDPRSKQFVDYLGGISAEGVEVSRDGRWMAYTTYPEGTLWRSRTDGSERVQLTFAPMAALLPRWSPDGTQLAFFGGTSTESYRVYVVPSTGGTPRRVTAGTLPEADPSWSPDGRHLVFGNTSGGQAGTTPNTTIQLLDLGTRELSTLPGSEGFFSPRWSPDGRYIVALSLDSLRMVLFEVASHTWTDLGPRGAFYGWPFWSPDGTSITFNQGTDIRRITMADRHVETIVGTADINLAVGALGPWLGSTPDGWPVTTLEAGAHDIYALDWDAP